MDPLRAVEKHATESRNAYPRDWYERNGDNPWNGVGEVRAELAKRPYSHKTCGNGDSMIAYKGSEKGLR